MATLQELLDKNNLTSSDVADLIKILADTVTKDTNTIQFLYAIKTTVAKQSPQALDQYYNSFYPRFRDYYQAFIDNFSNLNSEADNTVNLILNKLGQTTVYRDSSTDSSVSRIQNQESIINQNSIQVLIDRLANEASYRNNNLLYVADVYRDRVNSALDDQFAAIRNELAADQLLLQFLQTELNEIQTAEPMSMPKSSPDVPLEQAPPAPNPIPQPAPTPSPILTAPTPVTPVDPTPSEPSVPIVVIPPYTPVITPTVPTNTNQTTVVESNSTQVVKANPVPITNTSVDSSVAKPRAMFDSAPTTNRCVGTIQKPLRSPCPVSV